MKEENLVVVWALLLIALSSFAAIAMVILNQGPETILNQLILIPVSVVSVFGGYLTKSISDKFNALDTPSTAPKSKQAGTASALLIICMLTASVFSIATFSGCAGHAVDGTPEPTICDEVTNSWICTTIRERGWDPATVRDYIIDVDLAVLAVSENYTKTDALSYTQTVRDIVVSGCSYRYLIKWIGENSYKMSDDMQGVAAAGIIVVSRHINAFDSTMIISNDDKRVVLKLLDKIDAAVNQYF